MRDAVPIELDEDPLNVGFEEMELEDEEVKDFVQRQRPRWKELVRHPARVEIVVRRGAATRMPVVPGLENWLRRQARVQIRAYLPALTQQLGRSFGQVYVMGQRTKWGNCSSRGNPTFNWRLILAPDTVFHYLVGHEVAHLAVPDHSAKFWLTVQSLCPEMERAKQWLSRHHASLTVDLGRVVNQSGGLERE